MNQTVSEGTTGTVPAVVFANAKGGVGKSTLAFLATVYLASRGIRICFIDCDPQGTGQACIARFVDGRMITAPRTAVAPSTTDRNDQLNKPSAGHFDRGTVDLLVIDTAAGTDPRELAFLRPADLVIVPTSSSDLDIAATRRFVQRLTRPEPNDTRRGHGHVLLAPNQARGSTDVERIRAGIPEAHVLKPVQFTPAIHHVLHAGREEAEVLEALRGSRDFFRQLETWVSRARQHMRSPERA